MWPIIAKANTVHDSMQVGYLVAQPVVGRGAKVQCELGGQNSSVVLANANLYTAAETIAYAAPGYAGQKYTATSRVIVEDTVCIGLRNRLVSKVEAMCVTNPENELCQVGPLIDEHARDSALETAERSHRKVITGGKLLDRDGFYLAPTLVQVSNPMDHLAQKEVFAPVTALLRASSAEEALRIANGGRRGGAVSVH
jgi:acyl-CoA reductase-like NAD-dependent aldehyde dehydrogenase